MSLMNQIVERAKANKQRIVLPEGTEEYNVSFPSTTKVYLYSKSTGEVTLDTSEGGKIQEYESARHNASKIYLLMSVGKPTFAVVVTE